MRKIILFVSTYLSYWLMHHALSSFDSVGVSGYELDLTSPAVIQPLLVF